MKHIRYMSIVLSAAVLFGKQRYKPVQEDDDPELGRDDVSI